MSNKKTNEILKEVLIQIKPSKKELQDINNSVKEFLDRFNKKIKKHKINAEIFIGGSFAKDTVIKKDKYDVDIFVRYDKKYNNDISNLTEKLLKGEKNISKIHGSRDYFRIKINNGFLIELIPVIKVKSPKEAKNITDLSYSHVKYIKDKIKNKNILDEIRLAKAFCHANNCYGAESYINGFSGYSLELLVYYYGSFIKFINAIAKSKNEKIIIDIEKQYKNKQKIMMDINSSKLNSPIILIDPTSKQRNAAAALSKKTFDDFKKICKSFIKNPNLKYFEITKLDIKNIKNQSLKKNYDFVQLTIKTNKQEGDIAGSKLLKFYRHLDYELNKLFNIQNKGFEYNGDKSADCFFSVKRKKELLLSGPSIKDIKNAKAFKKKHKKTFNKNNKIYAKEKININLNKFISDWKNKNKRKLKEMSIVELKIL